MVSYCSTRGQTQQDFPSVLLEGLAADGGLYSPVGLPDPLTIPQGQNFQEVLEQVLWPFLKGWISDAQLREMIERAFKDFRDKQICPLKEIEEGHFLLDLTLGPTLAFKDFALQMLAQMLDFELSSKGRKALVIGATSGDTGSAAIEALRKTKMVSTVMLHPKGRVSPIQRRQMTTVLSDNVLNLAVDGSFDDCQDLVKAAFVDKALRDQLGLTAVNSINWGRVLVQVSYYFYACSAISATPLNPVSFAVPTGNFGNVLAGWYAKRLGAPIDRLIVATNHNDTFPRFLDSGVLLAGDVTPSLSPSMDIQIPSNLERLLWELSGKDSPAIVDILKKFRKAGEVRVPEAWMQKLRAEFSGFSVQDAETIEEIRRVKQISGITIDPHTAVATKVATGFASRKSPVITLETADPAKFPDSIEEALGEVPDLPAFLADLPLRQERFEALDNSYPNFVERIQDFVDAKAIK